MRYIYHLECGLIWTSLLAFTGLAATASTHLWFAWPYLLLGFVFVLWGFSLWRKMKVWDERETHQSALPWFEALFYALFAGIATTSALEEFIGIPKGFSYILLALYLLTPIIGIVGVAFNLRRDIIKPNQSERTTERAQNLKNH